MRSFTIVIPDTPISQNSDTWKGRWTRRKYKRDLEEVVFWLCKEQRIPALGKVRLSAVVYWGDKRKRDFDNFFTLWKVAQDGLVNAGVIADDDQAHIPESPTLRFEHDPEFPRTEITIAEVE